MSELTTIQLISVWILPVIFAVTVHESAHGYAAYLLGDRTAYLAGRLTINPWPHVDWLGTIVVPMVMLWSGGAILGWAKPVPIDLRNLEHPRRDSALIAGAGPLANLLLAVGWKLIETLGKFLLAKSFPGAAAIYTMGSAGVQINLILLIFNLLPLPPLDGSQLLAAALPPSLARRYQMLAPYGFPILLGLILLGGAQYLILPPLLWLDSCLDAVFRILGG